jgi:hypothetical protein
MIRRPAKGDRWMLNRRDLRQFLETLSSPLPSGNDHYNPVRNANWNPITPKYWPVFACSISEMDQTDLTGCVKSY